MRVVIATGTGRYADPWHPFNETSEAIASILSADGADMVVAEVDVAMQVLDGVDLLVVNAGDPWRHGGTPAAVPPASLAGLASAMDRGIGILAVHTAVSSLRDYPIWAPAIGAVWIPSVSMHPPAGPAGVHIIDHTLTQGMTDFEVTDERYCFLQMLGESRTLAEHTHDGATFPTAWIRRHGKSRVACSVLGHNEQSYESAGNRALLRRLADWASPRDRRAR